MATLLVRGLDDDLPQRLRERAAANGNSAEAEHRAILVAALRLPQKRSFVQFLSTMPNVGEDADFARQPDLAERKNVFD
jgi:antitoxin FitA